jgi:hypothetical protein
MTARRARTVEEEADHLLALFGGDGARVFQLIQGQLTQLASRAQVLLQLAGLTITVTGFSGANIARSGTLAAILVVSGLVIVLVAASLSMGGILRVRWVTQLAPCPARDAIIAALEMRDRKTRAFSRSLALLIVGLALYIGSVSMLLLGNLPGWLLPR